VASSRNTNELGNTASDSSGDVALLIDYENLQISLRHSFNVTTPQMSLIVQEAQEHGRLVLARAYAPWTSPELAIDAENLYRQGIEPVYIPSQKNSADVRLAVDAVETAVGASNIQTFVIVTGDGDLIHATNFLRQHGRKVVVIGVDSAMSRMLSSAADTVLLYERDLDPSIRGRQVQRSSRRQPVTPAPSSEPHEKSTRTLVPLNEYPPAEEAFEMVRDAMTRRSDGEPVLFQELGHWLGQDHGLKPRAWYGVPFSVFMDAAEEAGYVVLTRSAGNSYASLPIDSPSSSTEDDIDNDDDSSEDDPGLDVRLESLRAEEQRDLFEELRQLQASQRSGYLTFSGIIRHLLSRSVLPRLSERQIRRLLNDLADRNPPILVRSQRKGRNAQGPYTFSAFTLTTDESLLKGESAASPE
jgi:uncharacterized protein (TIGR00288 family)